MIDWARVDELRSEIGEDGFLEVAALFVEEIAKVIESLRPGMDSNALKSDLHFVKGSAVNLGFADLAGLCAAGERQLATDEAVDTSQIIDCYKSSVIALQEKHALA